MQRGGGGLPPAQFWADAAHQKYSAYVWEALQSQAELESHEVACSTEYTAPIPERPNELPLISYMI